MIMRKSAIAIVLSSTLLGVSPLGFAQTNAVGSIFGTTADGATTVTVTSTETGAVVTSKVDSKGRFQVTSLPVGAYKVEVSKDGKPVAVEENVFVTIGAGSEVVFSAKMLDKVVVKGAKATIDVSATDTRTVLTAKQLEKLSVKRSIEELTLLAPGTVRGDSRYTTTGRGNNSTSFGGSGANENAIYINGYAVTDPIKGLGSSSLPFDSIGQYQLLTGGYGAEFGRSTGGVINIVSKRGTNKWTAGGMVSYTPSDLTEDNPDIYYPHNGTTLDGLLWNKASERKTESMLYGAYAGGPIIKDKLFIYANAEMENRTTDGPRPTGNASGTAATDGIQGWHDRDIDVPRWLVKVDWNIADGHALELSAISDVKEEHREFYEFRNNTPTSTSPNLRTKGSVSTGGFDYTDGGELYIAKYTGRLLDNLTFTGLYGQQETKHEIIPIGYDASVVPVRDDRSSAGSQLSFGSLTSLTEPDSYDKTDGYRLDLEWLLGSHSIRGGYDVQNLEVFDGTNTAGPTNSFWFYEDGTPPGTEISGSGGAISPASGEYVSRVVSKQGGKFKTEQYAYFIEDRWQVLDDVLLSVGLRNENFVNYSADGRVFLDSKDQWAPRLGISWDVYGDASLRTFANYGRYHLAIPLNLAFRQVGATTNTSEYFSFTGINPATGEPTGLAPIGDGPFSQNGEYGQARDPSAAAAQGLEGYYQDEYALGVEAKVLKDYNAGVRVNYRELLSQIDDNCDPRVGYNWAIQNGYGSGVDTEDYLHGVDGANGLDDAAERFGAQTSLCRIINPGEDNTLLLATAFVDPNTGAPANGPFDGVPAPGSFVSANISASEWGLEKLKRNYVGVDTYLEHPLRDNWYGKVAYTWAHSYGNAEGQLLSDFGQQDVAVTLNWDHPELMAGAYGPLPNDRRHQIKAYGFYQFTPEWRVSAGMSTASGKPRALYGVYTGNPELEFEGAVVGPDATFESQAELFENYVSYGNNYHFQNGSVSSRGASRTQWLTLFDVGATYAPNALKNQLKLSIDVFNLFNTLKPQAYVEISETAPGVAYHSYNRPVSYNAPRSVRFTLRYDWGQ